MIISASRRTDIPAFYADWFLRRVRAGYCTVPNPFNPSQVRHVSLIPEDVDVIVFWTRFSRPLRHRLKELDRMNIPYYFLFTLTPYSRALEPHLPSVNKLVKEFCALANTIGPERVIWRYDPILVGSELTFHFHRRQFTQLASALNGCTKRVIISLADYYRKTERNLRQYEDEGEVLFRNPETIDGFDAFLSNLVRTGNQYGMTIQSCAESVDLKSHGIQPGKCIDNEYIEQITGKEVTSRKDPGQRAECRCVHSVDIGMYDTCRYGCRYCYATSNYRNAIRNQDHHRKDSPSLLDSTPSG